MGEIGRYLLITGQRFEKWRLPLSTIVWAWPIHTEILRILLQNFVRSQGEEVIAPDKLQVSIKSIMEDAQTGKRSISKSPVTHITKRVTIEDEIFEDMFKTPIELTNSH